LTDNRNNESLAKSIEQAYLVHRVTFCLGEISHYYFAIAAAKQGLCYKEALSLFGIGDYER
jgi:hypothetical protein